MSDNVIPEAYRDLLDSTALAHVSTIGPNGEPQVSPVWFGWDGEHISFSLTTARQKYRNLTKDARIGLSIVDPQNAYRYLEVRGTIARIDEDPNIDFISSMAKKYLGQERYPWHREGDVRVVMVVKPDHTTQMGS